ncbi:Ubiquitin conjugation factor E4 B [Fasciola hepatica]|uniref:RING-type E3 ubiquitin transferase n=1 Tax=Fasciola hepatica TaxID=6192 RepID=A0A4E0QW64_FASHE|nr:Ubiquitin conjugation factor E4 B [Fasciola hepatica]
MWFSLPLICITSLKVRNPESYGWAPKTLLAQLVAIYRHLGSEDDRFALALSKDERCFSRELFENACTLMSRHGIQTADELENFARLGAKADELARSQTEVDYGEIPAEFCDTLINTLMEDPVMLPQSQAIVDRSTIMQHLLNQETDPFNRLPLREVELIPLPDLKKRISEWKADREAKWRASQRTKPRSGDDDNDD